MPSKSVVDHLGAEVLRHEFWVVAEKIPTSLRLSIETRQLAGTRDDLQVIARCLAFGSSARSAAAQSVYNLIVELTSDEQISDTWRAIARSTSVYRLFRNGDIGPDRLVSGEELFLGDKDVNNDFGQALYCLGTGDDRRKNVRKLYRRLGVKHSARCWADRCRALTSSAGAPQRRPAQEARGCVNRIPVRASGRCAKSRRTPHEGSELCEDLRALRALFQ